MNQKSETNWPAVLSLLFLLLITALLLSTVAAAHADTLIPVGATWSYLDTGTDVGTAWRETNFNDSAWLTGPTQLGFGDGDEQKVINGGPSGSRYPTTYFRNTFVVANRSSITNLALRLMRDDGAIVYLNGIEVFRSNMPDEPAAFTTWAALPVAGSEESAFFPAALAPERLLSGTNVMAVEIHQSDAASSDLSFSLELLANTPLGNLPPLAALAVGPPGSQIVAAGEPFTLNAAASDPETSVARIDVVQDGAQIQTVFANATTVVWSNAVPGIHEFTARATDSAGAAGNSAPVRILVTNPAYRAHSVFFPQFSSASGLIVQNNATISSNLLHLTHASVGSGGAWIASQQNVRDGFVSDFRFRIICKGGGGADGLAFVIAGTTQAQIGTGLGYTGITNSLAVEFDTWQNTNLNDPDDHHISVHSRGPLANTNNESASLGIYTPPSDFSDGVLHQVRIDYLPGNLRIFLDNLLTPVLTLNVDLSTLLTLPGGNAWIGLTAGSGSSFENHDITAWSYTSYSIPTTISLTSPAQAIRVEPGSNLTVSAAVTAPPGQSLVVDFLDGNSLLGTVTNVPFSFVWSNAPAGIHVLSARTADRAGLPVFSQPIVVEVVPSSTPVTLFPDFSNSEKLLLQGSAALLTNRVRIAPALGGQVGACWLNSKQVVGNGFETAFQFQITQPSTMGADGLTFLILGSGSPAFGDAGAGLGYQTLMNSLAVEFDMFQNAEESDVDGNHVSVHSRGTAPNSANESASLGRFSPSINMSDGAIHTVVVRYSGGFLRVFLDDSNVPVMKVPLDLATLLSLDNGAAWVGLTASTGNDFENHDLLMWSFQPSVPLQVHLTLAGNGGIGLGFPTTPGQTYAVQYSLDLLHWTDADPSLTGTGAIISWQDTGPPVTDSPPESQPQRFYRVMVLP